MAAKGSVVFRRLEKWIRERWMLGSLLTGLDAWPPAGGKKPDDSITVDRLNWSVQWHTLASRQAMRWYTVLKFIEIVAAAAIPLLTGIGGNSSVTKGWIAGLGALIVVLEGLQQLKKYAQNGLLWAQGKEALKREYYLYEANVPPYDKADRKQQLALRVEQIIGREVAQWSDHGRGTDGDKNDKDEPKDPNAAPAQ
jgi:Protein of unknown function (DUF4231)